MAATVAISRRTARALGIVAAAALVILPARPAIAIEAQDECVDTAPVDAVRFEETVDTRIATTGVADPLQSCSTDGANRNANSIWYRYIAPATGTLTVSALTAPFPGTPPTVITVSTGECAALQEIACGNNPSRGDTSVLARVDAESVYWIEIASEAGMPGGIMQVMLALDPDSPICPTGGGTFVKAAINLVGLGAPLGNERLKITARVVFPEPMSKHASDGLQLLLDSFVPEYSALAEWSVRTIPIPAGGPGMGCDPRDGWTTSKNGASRRYRNHSNALPPGCLGGSANGLKEVRLLRKSADWRIVDVKVRAKDMRMVNLPTFEGSHHALVWLSTTLGPETAASCASTRPPLACVHNGKATAITCRLE